jgi:hypothetical protein
VARETKPKISKAIHPYEQKDPPEKERVLDFDALLTPEEKAKIRAKALDKIQIRDKLDAEEAYLKLEMARLDKEAHPEVFEEERDILLDLPDFCNPIRINGKEYYSGHRYTVPVSLCAVFLETQNRIDRHLRELERGNRASDNFYRRPRNFQIDPDGRVLASDGRPVRF